VIITGLFLFRSEIGFFFFVFRHSQWLVLSGPTYYKETCGKVTEFEKKAQDFSVNVLVD